MESCDSKRGENMKSLSKARVLITGAGGFIGSHLCELCLSQGAEVRAFVHYNSRNDWGMLEDIDKRKLQNVEVVTGDLRDPDAVRRAVKGCNYVFHLGALIGIPYSYLNPADVVSTNVLGTLHVLQACLEHGVDRQIQTSTSEVYGTAQYVPMDERHVLNPQSPYAASKIGSDKLAESYYRTYGLPVTVLRPFNTYGPRQSPRAVIPTIITQAQQSQTIHLGSTDTTRDLTFVRDTASGFIAAALSTKAVGQTIQLGTGSEVSIAELVRLIGVILKKKLKIISEARRRRPKTSEVERLVSCNQRARDILGWEPQVELTDGLEKTFRWFQKNEGFYKHRTYHV
jgi:NAD dependent epimerase/dehydratase